MALALLLLVLGSSSLFLSASAPTFRHLPNFGDILAEPAYPSSPTNLFDIAADFDHIFDLPLYHEPVLSLVYGSLFEPLQSPRRGLGLDHLSAAIRSIRAFTQAIVQTLYSTGLGATECSDATLKLLSAFYTILRGGDWCAVAITLAVLLDLSLLLIRSVRPTRTHIKTVRPAPVSTLSVGRRKEVLGLVLRGSQVPRTGALHPAVDIRWLHTLFRRSIYLSPYPVVRMGVAAPTLVLSLPFDLSIPLGIRTRLLQANPATCQPRGNSSASKEGGGVTLAAPQPSRALVLTAGQRKEAMSLVLARSQVRDVAAVYALVNMGIAYVFRRSVHPITCPTAATKVYASFLVAKLLACLAIRPEGYTHAPPQARLLIEYGQGKKSPVVTDDKPKVEVEVEVELRAPAVRKAQREPKFVTYVARALRNATADSRKATQDAAANSLVAKKDRYPQEEQDARRGKPETRLGSLGPDAIDMAPEQLETTVDGGEQGAPKRKRTHRGKRGGRLRPARDPNPEL